MKKVFLLVCLLAVFTFGQKVSNVLSVVAVNSATNTSSAFVVHDSAKVVVQSVDSLCAAVWLLESMDGVNYKLQAARIDSIKFAGGGIQGYRLNSYNTPGVKYVKVRLIGFSAGNSYVASTTDLTKIWYKDFKETVSNY